MSPSGQQRRNTLRGTAGQAFDPGGGYSLQASSAAAFPVGRNGPASANAGDLPLFVR
jgi:hypothetical protein